MYLKSLFPPLPPLEDVNYHTFLFNHPVTRMTPSNHVQYIDGLSGISYTKEQFLEVVRDCGTALTAPETIGGLGLQINIGQQVHTRVVASRRPSPKEIVAILSPNCLDYVILVHACIAIAVPFVLVPSSSTSYELVYLLNKVTPTRLFVHPSLLQTVLHTAAEIKYPTDRIYLLGTSADSDRSRQERERAYQAKALDRPDLSSLIRNVRERRLPRQDVVKVNKDSLAYMVFSSGTSGRPKAVMVSHGNMQLATLQLLALLQEMVKLLPTKAPQPARGLCSLPFYHSYGLHFYMFRAFLMSSTCVIFPKWDIDAVLDAIPKYKITHITLVPSLVHQLVYSDKVTKVDLSSIENVACGAAYLPPKLAAKMRGLFGRLQSTLEGYGLSECTVASIMRPYPGMLGLQPKLDSTGILLAGQEARIVRPDGSEAGFDEPGELWLRGKHVVLGYWDDEQANRETFTPDGWLKTGDIFTVDESEALYFVDRAKDTLKISGAQVSPAEIEATLLDHPEKLIVDATVAGVSPPIPTSTSVLSQQQPSRGSTLTDEKVPRAWVVLTPAGKRLGADEVVRRLDARTRERLSKYKWLRGGIEVVEAIPKSPTGKVLRRVLQDKYEKELKSTRVGAKL